MTIREFLEAIGAETAVAVQLRSEQVLEAMLAFIAGRGLAADVVEVAIPRGVMISSANEGVLSQLVARAKVTPGAQIIRRLTLADLLPEFPDEGYERVETVIAIDRGDREHRMLMAKLRDMDILKFHVIVDAGMQSRARVLTVTLTVSDEREWEVNSYAITQYEMSSDDIAAKGEPAIFRLWDFMEPEDEGDKRTPHQRLRDAVTEYKTTGGQGENAWVAARVEEDDGNRQAAFDNATTTLVGLCDSYGKILRATAGSIIGIADEKFPIQGRRSQIRNRNKRRGYQREEGFNNPLASALTARPAELRAVEREGEETEANLVEVAAE